MSADNGIYILKTPKGAEFEYRVSNLQAVENVYWDNRKSRDSEDPLVWIENAREMWQDSPVWHTEDKAWEEARRQFKMACVCEYGIQVIEIPKEFAL